MPRIVPGPAPAPAAPVVGSGLVSLGTGDGSTMAFELPAADIVGLVVYVAAVPQPAAAVSISRGTGPDGADQVVLDGAPAVGAAVEAFWVG